MKKNVIAVALTAVLALSVSSVFAAADVAPAAAPAAATSAPAAAPAEHKAMKKHHAKKHHAKKEKAAAAE